MKTQEKIEELLAWSKDKEWFNNEFILSMYDRLEDGMFLSERQHDSIANIHDRFCGVKDEL